MSAPILYFAPQTCTRVALTALEEIGAPFETRLVAFLAGEHRSPAFLAVNPSGKVPALVTADGTIAQNGAILGYLDATHPEAGLLPRRDSAAGRAAVLSELFRCSSDLHPLVTRFVMPQLMTSDEAGASHIRARAREGLEFQLAPLEERLGRQDWCFGEGWSILDAYLAWIWFRVTGAGFGADRFPAVAAHFERASARPSARAALGHEARAQDELKRRGLFFEPPTNLNREE